MLTRGNERWLYRPRRRHRSNPLAMAPLAVGPGDDITHPAPRCNRGPSFPKTSTSPLQVGRASVDTLASTSYFRATPSKEHSMKPKTLIAALVLMGSIEACNTGMSP